MHKDPAFLFYPKDWLSGTSDMMLDEKGAYIDLLAQQHQHRVLPDDPARLARMVGLSQDEFDRIWVKVSTKFIHVSGSMVNLKLKRVIDERAVNAKKKRIAGAFASWLKGKNLPKDAYKDIKKEFSVEWFLEFTEESIILEVSTWCSKWLSTWTSTR